MTMATLPLVLRVLLVHLFWTENVVLGGVRALTLAPILLEPSAFSTPAPLYGCYRMDGQMPPNWSSHLFSKWRLCSSINTANVIELSFPLNNIIS